MPKAGPRPHEEVRAWMAILRPAADRPRHSSMLTTLHLFSSSFPLFLRISLLDPLFRQPPFWTSS